MPPFLRLFLGTLLLSSGLLAQTDSIYNEDPFQKLPLGMEESAYRVREATPQEMVTPMVAPPFWWSDMVHREVELLLHAEHISSATVELEYPGLEIRSKTALANPNYLFLKLQLLPGLKAGRFDISLQRPDGSSIVFPYEFLEQDRSPDRIQGLGPEDLIYLILPDRFANGDSSNDSVAGMQQMGTNRQKVYFRHGGDLKGVIDRLDYLQDLGVTAIWLNPILENDQPYESYHGYAVTDHYQIDARLGENATYLALVKAAHKRGIKVIMDVIFNHVGDKHWFIQDLPTNDWIHQGPKFQRSNFRAPTLIDPYASEYDRNQMVSGWFDHHMPDLNQQQPQLANFLIQNSIWWTAYSGQDAFRIDTYAYPDRDFMAQWNQRLLKEFPQLGIYGEVWDHGPAVQAAFTQGYRLHPEFNSHLAGITDFQMQYAILESLNADPSWTNGVLRLYYTLTQDFLYENPYLNVLFLDNHDLARFYTMINEDPLKFRSGIALLLTLRGIPMLYYGTELQLGGSGGSFGEGGRVDFPGGWKADDLNKFKKSGRTEAEQAAFEYVRRLCRYRQKEPALQDGRLTQFVPVDGLYVYFRHNTKKTILVAFNGSNETQQLNPDRYRERIGTFTRAYDVTNDRIVDRLDSLKIQPKEALILELK